MSKSYSIQKKLWKAYGKVAKKLGEDNQYLVYRSSTLSDPIVEGNWVATTPVSFSQDNAYNKAHDGGLSLWLCWIDGRLTDNFDLQQGDFVCDPDTESVYFIASAQRNLPIRAIKATSTISVNRGGYTDGPNGYAPGDIQIAQNIPCWVEDPGAGGGGLGYVPAGNYNADSVPTHKIYCWDPAGELQRRDAIVDQNGNRMQILNIDNSDMGTLVTATAYNAE